MKINEKSWHFRLLQQTCYSKARRYQNNGGSLCGYFWSVVWELVCLASMAFLMLGALWIFVYQPISYIWAPDDDKFVIVMIWAILLGVGAASFVGVYIHKKLPKKDKNKTKEPNILVEYIRAKKQKFCPIIEIVKEEK